MEEELKALAEAHDIEMTDLKTAHSDTLLDLKSILEMDMDTLRTEYAETVQAIEAEQTKLNSQKNASSGSAEDGSDSAVLDELNSGIAALKVKIEEQANKIEVLNTLLGNRGYLFDADGNIKYTVTRGDTLNAICKKCGIDYKSMKDKILKLNNINDENLIQIGQILKIPLG